MMLRLHHKLIIFALLLGLIGLGVVLALPTIEKTISHSFAQPGTPPTGAPLSPQAARHQRLIAARRHRAAAAAAAAKARAPLTLIQAWIRGMLLMLFWVGPLVLGLFGAYVVNRRFANRLSRHYRRFEVHLSMHDEAKPRDLDDMIEAIINAIRPVFNQRVRDGQPFIAIELVYLQIGKAMEWTMCMVCEERTARVLEGIIAQTYPDVWLGRRFDEARVSAGPLLVPGHVLRFRKRHPHMYPLSRPEEGIGSAVTRASSPIEGIARVQVEVGVPSIVRFQMIPVIESSEGGTRLRLRQHEHRIGNARQGLRSAVTLSEEAELTSAVNVQNRAMLNLEVQVAAQDYETANAVASRVMAHRGHNRLHRRQIRLRQRMYRNRFPTAYPPWLPSFSTKRPLVSAGEVAWMFEFPTARMKGVPVRRLTRPRIPIPPEMMRTTDYPMRTCLTDAQASTSKVLPSKKLPSTASVKASSVALPTEAAQRIAPSLPVRVWRWLMEDVRTPRSNSNYDEVR